MISVGLMKKIPSNSFSIEITAQHAGSGKVVAGPLRGTLFNLSQNDACLLMNEIMDEAYHFFYSTQEDNLLFLNIFFEMSSVVDEQIKLTAIPLWFNSCRSGHMRNFIMGVQFTKNVEERTVKKILTSSVAQ
ncbi:MAG: hypothetical protein D3909_16225 [Candidatus Electrothrix sp. ATG1]|nr:hypothetical protein [Candidatus Electrothrix sp. ATG1]